MNPNIYFNSFGLVCDGCGNNLTAMDLHLSLPILSEEGPVNFCLNCIEDVRFLLKQELEDDAELEDCEE